MLNEVILVGKIKDINDLKDNKEEIILDVERPFDDKQGRTNDTFVCKLWYSIFSKITTVCSKGDLLAIKGRLLNENNEIFIMAEKVVLLNKNINKNNVLK